MADYMVVFHRGRILQVHLHDNMRKSLICTLLVLLFVHPWSGFSVIKCPESKVLLCTCWRCIISRFLCQMKCRILVVSLWCQIFPSFTGRRTFWNLWKAQLRLRHELYIGCKCVLSTQRNLRHKLKFCSLFVLWFCFCSFLHSVCKLQIQYQNIPSLCMTHTEVDEFVLAMNNCGQPNVIPATCLAVRRSGYRTTKPYVSLLRCHIFKSIHIRFYWCIFFRHSDLWVS